MTQGQLGMSRQTGLTCHCPSPWPVGAAAEPQRPLQRGAAAWRTWPSAPPLESDQPAASPAPCNRALAALRCASLGLKTPRKIVARQLRHEQIEEAKFKNWCRIAPCSKAIQSFAGPCCWVKILGPCGPMALYISHAKYNHANAALQNCEHDETRFICSCFSCA